MCKQSNCDSSCRNFQKCPRRLAMLDDLLLEAGVGKLPDPCFTYPGQLANIEAARAARNTKLQPA